MRIAHITAKKLSSTHGGLEIYLQDLINAQIKEGNRILCLCLILTQNTHMTSRIQVVEEPVIIDELNVFNIDYCLNQSNKNAWIEPDYELVEVIQKELVKYKIDLCHCHSVFAQEAILASKYLHIPVICTAHCVENICVSNLLYKRTGERCLEKLQSEHCVQCCGHFLPAGYIWNFLIRLVPACVRKFIEKYLDFFPFMYFFTPLFTQTRQIRKIQANMAILSIADCLIAPSQAMSEALIARGLTNVKLIPHCIPHLPRLPMPLIQNNIVKFYYVGRICPEKGLHILLKACTKLKIHNYELHIFGESSSKHEKRYQQKLISLSKGSNVVWHGKIPHDELSKYILNLHVFVHPAIWFEVFGLAITEALSVGRPVLATRCGGAEMQITSGYNGWLVEQNNVTALIEKITNILSNPSVIEFYAKNCSAEPYVKHTDSIIFLYNSLIKKNNI